MKTETLANNKYSYLKKVFFLFFIALLSTIILTISAKIKVPFYPVPMTMQTFVVAAIGILFGYKLGLTIISIYIIEGLLGFPVFAGTPEKGIGYSYIIGPTFGYLLGFFICVYLSGRFEFKKSYFYNFALLIISVSFIYCLGAIWLGYLIGWNKPIFDLGVKPFLLAELFKILLLVVILPQLLKVKSKIKKII